MRYNSLQSLRDFRSWIALTLAIIMKRLTIICLSLLVAFSLSGEPKQLTLEEVCKLTDCRDPLLVKLFLDKENIYNEELGKSPYVFNDLAYIAAGEEFYLDVQLSNGQISKITYSKEKDDTKNQIHLRFSQENQGKENPMMMLKVQNPFNKALSYEAGMILHDREGVFGTSIIPVMPKLLSFESWSHPIVQLILTDFQLVDEE